MVDVVRLYASFMSNLLLLKGQRCVLGYTPRLTLNPSGVYISISSYVSDSKCYSFVKSWFLHGPAYI